MEHKKIQTFEQLIVWQESQNLAIQVYKTTNSFPKEELFGLTSQIRRAASSVSANIAEGFGRNTTKDKLQFFAISYGSLLETKNFLYLAQKLSYITMEELTQVLTQATLCQKLLNGYTRAIKSS